MKQTARGNGTPGHSRGQKSCCTRKTLRENAKNLGLDLDEVRWHTMLTAHQRYCLGRGTERLSTRRTVRPHQRIIRFLMEQGHYPSGRLERLLGRRHMCMRVTQVIGRQVEEAAQSLTKLCLVPVRGTGRTRSTPPIGIIFECTQCSMLTLLLQVNREILRDGGLISRQPSAICTEGSHNHRVECGIVPERALVCQTVFLVSGDLLRSRPPGASLRQTCQVVGHPGRPPRTPYQDH